MRNKNTKETEVKMIEILVTISGDKKHERRIKEAITLTNSAQNYFLLNFDESLISLELDDGEKIIIDKALKKIFRREKKTICITSYKLDDNWFSHEEREGSIITINDWEDKFAPPSLRAFLVYEFAQALLSFEADISEEMLLRIVHEPPIGCIFDMCLDKNNIKLGMVSGNLCLQCEGILLQYGLHKQVIDAIRRILVNVRDEAIGRPKIFDANSAFIAMRFSTNDENSNAYKYGIKQGLEDVGIKVHRGDDVVNSGQILDKIIHSIERHRFIVVKVDVDNLNVYFELGLAMGLEKDVLLISESSLALNLPVDLRNWECLIYEKGNYEQLRERVAKFYQDNFGYNKSIRD